MMKNTENAMFKVRSNTGFVTYDGVVAVFETREAAQFEADICNFMFGKDGVHCEVVPAE